MKIFDRVADLLSGLSGVREISPAQKLREDLGLDSFRMVSLLVSLEDTFRIVLEESDMNPFDLIQVWQVVRLAEKYTGGDSDEETDAVEGYSEMLCQIQGAFHFHLVSRRAGLLCTGRPAGSRAGYAEDEYSIF